MATTTKHGLSYPVGSDASDVPKWIKALATDLDPKIATYATSTAALRPTAGLDGRIHRASDTGAVGLDTGSGYTPLGDAVYHSILQASGSAVNTSTGVWLPSGSAFFIQNNDFAGGNVVPGMWLQAADYALAGRTTKLRVSGTAFCNATTPGFSMTPGLYPLTASSGGSGNIKLTVGTAIAGSTVNWGTLAANNRFADFSSDFTFPSDGYYVLGLAVGGGPQSAASRVDITMQLKAHWA